MAKKQTVNVILEQPSDVRLDDLPLDSIEDYRAYNKEAQKQRKPLKIPPNEMHEQVEVRFNRFDQPENVLKFYKRCAEFEYKGQWMPGSTYICPRPVMDYLNGLSTPIYAEVKVDDGGQVKTETKQVGERPRFSCQLIRTL